MMNLQKSIALVLTTLSFSAHAQIASESETFINNQLRGTARFTAMGGAFTSLGNDASAIGINPATLSSYRFNEFSFSLGFETQQAQLGPFYGAEANQRDFSVNLENLGVGFQFGESPDDHKFSVGIYNNQLADCTRRYDILGFDNSQTLGQFWGKTSANGDVDTITDDAYAAWQAYVLVSDTVGGNDVVRNPNASYAYGRFDSTNNTRTATSDVSFTYNQTGSLNQTGFAISGQSYGKFSYGLGFGFPSLNLRREEFITEYIDQQDAPPYNLTEYTYRRLSDLRANGFNFNIGFLYAPIPEFRIGASYQSPSWYLVRQIYDLDVTARFNAPPFDGVNRNTSSDILTREEYSYRLRTPSIFRIGLSSVIAKRLILSADYQYTNAQNTRLYTARSSYNISDAVINSYDAELNQLFTNLSNSLAAGLEYKWNNLFIRGGYRLNQSPYDEAFQEETTGDVTIISGGLGYQFGAWQVNATYVQSNFDQNLVTYSGFDASTGSQVQVLDDLQTEVTLHNVVIGMTYKW